MTLPRLIGHADVLQQLGTLLAAGRLPHALLLHGPRGVGKRLLADHLAWRLICGAAPLGQGLEADSSAPAYHQLMAGSCPDLHVLSPDEGKKSTNIKQVRALLGNLQRTADTQRVVIVDSVDELTEESPHVLLKTLEEPRAGLTFLLISHALGSILPTIRSRSRLFRVGALTDTQQLAVRAANPDWQPPAADELSAMLHDLAVGATPAQAAIYQKITALRHKQAEMNLPAAWVAEAARGLLKHD